MEIRATDKLILIMLCEIYEKLEIKGEIEPEFIKTAIFNNYYWAIGWKYPGFQFNNTENPETVKEVMNILEMWENIEISYKKFSDEDKTELASRVEIFGKKPSFPGFDGNNECEHLSIMEFLIVHLKKFKHFKDRANLNSHSPEIDSYRRMLDVYLPYKKSLGRDKSLNINQMIEVFKERIHPQYR